MPERQYPAILTEQAWSIKYLLYGKKKKCFLRDTARNPEQEDSAIFSARLANHSAGFGSSRIIKAGY